MPDSLAVILPDLAAHLPDLLMAEAQLLPREPRANLALLGLTEHGGLTRKGKKALALLRDLALLMDLPLA